MLLKSINEILFIYWDPLCVNDNEKLADEYESYALNLLKYADKQKLDLKFIEDYLKHIEEDVFNLKVSEEARTITAHRIMRVFGG